MSNEIQDSEILKLEPRPYLDIDILAVGDVDHAFNIELQHPQIYLKAGNEKAHEKTGVVEIPRAGEGNAFSHRNQWIRRVRPGDRTEPRAVECYRPVGHGKAQPGI